MSRWTSALFRRKSLHVFHHQGTVAVAPVPLAAKVGIGRTWRMHNKLHSSVIEDTEDVVANVDTEWQLRLKRRAPYSVIFIPYPLQSDWRAVDPRSCGELFIAINEEAAGRIMCLVQRAVLRPAKLLSTGHNCALWAPPNRYSKGTSAKSTKCMKIS